MIVTTRYMSEELASDEEWVALNAAFERHRVDAGELRNLYFGFAVDRVRLVSDLLLIADSGDIASLPALEMVRRLAAVDSRQRRP